MLKESIKKLWSKERGETPFIIFTAFTFSLLIARVWSILTGAYKVQTLSGNPVTIIGTNLIIGGLHIHHITYGVICLAVAGLMSIYYEDKYFLRISAAVYGVGIGLIVDELGFIVEGLVVYSPQNLIPHYIIALLVLGFIGMLIYFPSFRREMKKRKIKMIK